YGVGIIQPSNALRALDKIGVAGKCMEAGLPFETFNLCAANGYQFTTASTPPLGNLPANNGIPRNVLHNIVLTTATEHGVKVRMGVSVAEIKNEGDTASVTFTDGSTGNYDLVIGADGAYSKVRNLVFGNEIKPQYTGQSVWRFTTERPEEVKNGYFFYGKKTKAGLVPMSKNTMYLLCVTAEGEGNPFIPEDELAGRLKAHLGEYQTPLITNIIDKIKDPKAIIYRPLETLLLPDPWFKNRVLIIGDAAHATIPQLGQGASLAVEDAVVLAEILAKEGNLADLLTEFMKRRFERCKLVVDVSKQVGIWEQMEWNGQLPPDVNIGALMGKTMGALMQPI
ncbi:MAG TPA: FAD-dependent monooxygenase, partial [Segetibacter sp.]